MNKQTKNILFVGILVIVILGIFLFLYSNFLLPYFKKSTLSSSKINLLDERGSGGTHFSSPANNNFPPLYPSLRWKEPKKDKIIFPDSKKVSVELEGYYIESDLFGENEYNKVFSFYDNQLTSGGWILDTPADGPDGGNRTYIKNGSYLTILIKLVSTQPQQYKATLMYALE